MDRRRELMERSAELAVLDEAVEAVRRGCGRLVVVEGPAGIGKTSLLAAARVAARERGLRVLPARGSELERQFPYGIVRQVFERALSRASSGDREEILGGVAVLAAPLFQPDFFANPVPAAEDQTFATLHGLYWLTVNLAEQQPLALVVDDLQWSDASSLRWLAHLLHRLDGLPVLVVVAVRPDEPDSEAGLLSQLVSDPAAVVLRPVPLSVAAVTLLVRRALGPDADEEFCAACREVTGGNPFLLQELVGALAAENRTPTRDEVAWVRRAAPVGIARSVVLRLERLAAEARGLARAVAVLGDGVELRHAADLADLQEERVAPAAALLARVDILRPELPLAFVHPIVRAAVYRDLALGERQRAHARAAALLEERRAAAEQVAAHLLLAPPAGLPFAVDQLREAARRSMSRGAAESAVAYLRRALDEPPEPAERADVLYELGSAERLLHAPSAARHLGEALALMADPQRHAEVALALGRTLFFSGQGHEAVAVLHQAASELGDADPALRQRLEAAALNVAIEDPALYPLAAERLARLRRRTPDATVGGRSLLAILAYQETRAGASRAQAVGRVELVLSGGLATADEGGAVFGFVASVLAHADRFADAAGVCDAALTDARARGSLFAFALASLLRGHVAHLRGALDDAEADARQALAAADTHGLDIGLPYAVAKLAETLLTRGDTEGAAATLGRLGLGEDVPATGHFHWFLESRARLRVLQGRARAGLADLLELGRRFEAVGGHNPAVIPWRSAAALVLLQLDDEDQARRLVTAEVALARRWGAPRALGRALRVAALVEGGMPGVELLRESLAALRDSPALLERAETLTDLGAALRRANRRAEARAPLREAVVLAHRCGAGPLERRAQDELLAAGARPRRFALSGADSLTPSEGRIASMATDGMTNREIAQALFVTPKTVEMHLHHVFRKLDIRSRAQLPRALADPTPPREERRED